MENNSLVGNRQIETLKIGNYWHVILRQRKYVVAVILLVLVLGLPLIYSLTAYYQSTTKIVVDSDQTKLVGFEVEAKNGNVLDYKVNSEVEIVKSNKVYLRVMKELKLWQMADYNELKISERFLALFGMGEGQPVNFASRPFAALSSQEVAEYIMKLGENIEVVRLHRTNVIEINVLSPRAQQAADIANVVTKAYLTEKVETQANSVRQAADILRKQLSKLSEDILANELKIENFIFEENAQISSAFVRDELGKLQDEIARQNKAKLQMNLQLSQMDRAFVARDYDLMSSLIGGDVALDLRGEDQTTLEQLKNINENYEQLAEKFRLNLNQSIGEFEVNIDSLKLARQTLFAEQDLPQNVSLKLYRLTKDIESKRNLYESELAKYSEVEQKIGILVPDVRVIATAYPATDPIKPNKLILSLGLMVFALLAALLVAVIRDRLVGGINSAEQLEAVLGQRPVSIIPFTKGVDVGNILLTSPLSHFAESIRMLRVGLDNFVFKPSTKTKMGQVIAISSTVPREGKTITAISLARSYAMAGAKTILVDLDFRHPAVAAHFDLKTGYGLQDLIRDAAGLEKLGEIICTETETGLDIAPSGAAKKTATDVLVQSVLLDKILDKFKADYDIVIIDTPPIGLVVDAQIIAEKVDQLVYAVKFASTNQKGVVSGVNLLRKIRPNLPISMVISQQDNAQANYKSLYGSHYNNYYSE